MHIKKEIRIAAFDDGPFKRGDKRTILIGAIYRGGSFMDGLLKTEIEVDGFDAEEKIINLANNSRHKGQIRIIMLDGITFGGFNTVDIKNICQKTKVPVIAVSRKKPNLEKFITALKRLEKAEERLVCIESAGAFYNYGKVWFQASGITIKGAKDIIKLTTTHSNIPEPLRIAHIIATGIVLGESVGRA